ncbi:MAG: hypothetical protein AAFO03_20475 [Bacteroidota bacterium]
MIRKNGIRKYHFYVVIIFALLVINLSCSSKIEVTQEGSYDVETSVFYSDKINWKLTVPSGWHITTLDTLTSQAKRGGEMLNVDENKYKVEEVITIQNLIGFAKNKQNSFTAFLEPYEYDKDKFEEYNRLRKELLFDQFYE